MKENESAAGTWIAEEGKPTSGLVILKTGKVALTLLQAGDTASVEIGPWEFFGELSLVDGDQARGVGAKAQEPVEFLLLSPANYRKLGDSSPEVAKRIAEGILGQVSQKITLTRQLLGEVLNPAGTPG